MQHWLSRMELANLRIMLLQLAYLGAWNSSSSSSLGLLGCLVFGLLYFKEKQANVSSASALEDVQAEIQRVEADLSTQTRHYIEYKLEDVQVGFESGRNMSVQDAVKCQLSTIKSSIAEKEQKLTASKEVLKALKQQAINLVATLDETKRYCSSHSRQIKERYSWRQGLEAEIKRLEVDLHLKVNAVSKLKVTVGDQEQACNNLMEQIAAAECSSKLACDKLLELQAKLTSLSDSLSSSKKTFVYLSSRLSNITARNVSLEVQLKNFLRCLENEQASFKAFQVELNEQLVSCRSMADAFLLKLSEQQDIRDMELRTAGQLTTERGALNILLKEKTLEDVREALRSALGIQKQYEMELHTLHQQVQWENEQNATLQSTCQDNTVVKELLEVSSQLEGQVTVERELAERLKKEIHEFDEALRLSRQDLLELQEDMVSTLSSQKRLKDDLTRLNELQQIYAQDLKKEKRAAAYAKRQLIQTNKILAQESQVVEGLEQELDCERKSIEDSMLQISTHKLELEKVTKTILRLADGFTAPQGVFQKEQAPQTDVIGSKSVPLPSSKPSRRRGLLKAATPKL